MESYASFLDRINSFEQSELMLGDMPFEVNPTLHDKVDKNGRFKPFYGDTLVFALDDEIKSKLFSITDALYDKAGCCLAERLKKGTFHVTLHDLNNSPELSCVAEDMFRSELTLLKYAHSGKIARCTINFETNYIINMAGTSIVLAVKPKSEADYNLLINLYGIANCVKALPYPMTPHITLAYFNPNGFDEVDGARLCDTVNELNKESFGFSVSSDKLYYEKFTNMNSYHRVFTMTNHL